MREDVIVVGIAAAMAGAGIFLAFNSSGDSRIVSAAATGPSVAAANAVGPAGEGATRDDVRSPEEQSELQEEQASPPRSDSNAPADEETIAEDEGANGDAESQGESVYATAEQAAEGVDGDQPVDRSVVFPNAPPPLNQQPGV
jgi:hypothetical protein